MSTEVINIAEKLTLVKDYWSPVIVGELNNQHVKLAKLSGEFVMHFHEHEDEMFFVLKGELHIEFENQTKTVKPGEFIIIPKGVLHKPIAPKEVEIMLFEPCATLNTGNVKNHLTKNDLDKI